MHCLPHDDSSGAQQGHTAAHLSVRQSTLTRQIRVPAMFPSSPILVSHLVLPRTEQRRWLLPEPRSVPLLHVSFHWYLLLESLFPFHPATPTSTYIVFQDTLRQTLASWSIPGVCQLWMHSSGFALDYWYTYALFFSKSGVSIFNAHPWSFLKIHVFGF